MPVDTPCPAYKRLAVYWEPILALTGGTPAMRDAGDTFLPRDSFESDEPQLFENRLKRTVLFNAFDRTVRKLTDLPFAKPVEFIEGVPEDVSERFTEDADLAGTTITGFARLMIDDVLRMGKAHFLVDVARLPERKEGDPPLSLSDDEALGLGKAYFSRVHPCNLIGWKTERIGGKTRVLEARIKDVEMRDNPEDEFCQDEIEVVKVYRPGEVQIWEREEDGGRYSLARVEPMDIDCVPLVTIYADKAAPLVSYPPLSSLAEMNVSHWQNNSDQESFLHAARLAIMFGRGFEADTLKNTPWGPGLTLTNASPESDLKWVETSGASLKAGADHMQKIEDQMEAMGIELLVKRRQLETATKTNQRSAEATCILQQIVVSTEEGFDQAFNLVAKWENRDEIAEVAVQIHQDFGLTEREAHDLEFLLKARGQNEISRFRFLTELRRRTIFSDLDVEEEMKLIAEEEKARMEEMMARMGEPGTDPPPSDPEDVA